MHLRKYEPRVVGPHVRAFLCQHFGEDRSQRPEFEAGFSALRRVELIALAKVYGLEIDPDTAKNAMLPKFDDAWIDGKFPPAPTQGEAAAQALLRSLPDGALESLAAAELERRKAAGPAKVAKAS